MLTKVKLIVYGTLMRGKRASLEQYGGTFIGTTILPRYKMYTNGWYPMVVPSESKTDIICGEIWEIDKEQLKYVDAYEGHPLLFKRTEIEPDTYIYLYQESVRLSKRLFSGYWNESEPN